MDRPTAEIKLEAKHDGQIYYLVVSVEKQQPTPGHSPRAEWVPGPARFYGQVFGLMGNCRHTMTCKLQRHECPFGCVATGEFQAEVRDCAEAMADGINRSAAKAATANARKARQAAWRDENRLTVRKQNLAAVKRYNAKKKGEA